MGNDKTNRNALTDIYHMFFDGDPDDIRVVNTGRGEQDFREAVIITANSGEKHVIKISDNDFTFPEKITVWERTVEEYRKLGYYCPRILRDRSGGFPYVSYKGRRCVVYAEEFAPYLPAEDRAENDAEAVDKAVYERDMWIMTARVAEQHFDYSDFPSAYCLYERFCPSDKTDEVLEVALKWKEEAEALPVEFQPQVQRIWQLWTDNRDALEPLYRKLPTSVFQADLNTTNILLDEGRFVGVYDFNLCGRDVFINYLIRENSYDDREKQIKKIRELLKLSRGYYHFSDEEKRVVTMLFRCLTTLWYTAPSDRLGDKKDDKDEIKKLLDETEHYLTAPIEFADCM